MVTPDEILQLWYPPGFDRDDATLGAQVGRWFRGGYDEEIVRRYAAETSEALDGGFAAWEAAPRDRLALVLLLDQFPRSLYRNSPRAFAGAPRAEALVVRTLDAGEERAMPLFEQMFLGVVLGHSESLALQDRGVALFDAWTQLLPPSLHKMGEISRSQARAHRDEIVRFGRHPARNPILGRATTPEEQHFLDTEGPAHLRNAPKPQ
jgi:uncharacterized protein (DUF924 family)